jgi:hypothetical protein
MLVQAVQQQEQASQYKVTIIIMVLVVQDILPRVVLLLHTMVEIL